MRRAPGQHDRTGPGWKINLSPILLPETGYAVKRPPSGARASNASAGPLQCEVGRLLLDRIKAFLGGQDEIAKRSQIGKLEMCRRRTNPARRDGDHHLSTRHVVC